MTTQSSYYPLSEILYYEKHPCHWPDQLAEWNESETASKQLRGQEKFLCVADAERECFGEAKTLGCGMCLMYSEALAAYEIENDALGIEDAQTIGAAHLEGGIYCAASFCKQRIVDTNSMITSKTQRKYHKDCYETVCKLAADRRAAQKRAEIQKRPEIRQLFEDTHPLEAVALKAMENGEAQDAIKLVAYLAGRIGSLEPPLLNAYKRVAQDVLNNLEARGLIVCDAAGWYRLAKKVTAK
jgi:hypothetical protein